MDSGISVNKNVNGKTKKEKKTTPNKKNIPEYRHKFDHELFFSGRRV